jgi:hypothetical protein
MRILVMGPMWVGSNALSLANGFRQLGHEVRSIDTTRFSRPVRFSADWILNRVDFADRMRRMESLFSAASQACASWAPDVLVCYKTVMLPQDELLSLQIPLKIHYSPDDVSNGSNVSDDYLRYEDCWDAVVTTKRHNVSEIQERTAGKCSVIFVMSAYDPAWHHPVVQDAGKVVHDVSFIGHYRPDRAGTIELIAGRYAGNVGVYGDGWRRHRRSARANHIHRPVYGERFSEVVAQSRVNLVLLNSENRDTHTCRSFEVPAAGGLVVGERTEEHCELLEEGREAIYFAGREEMLDAIDRSVADYRVTKKIAQAGERRIRQGSNTYADRAQEILRSLLH